MKWTTVLFDFDGTVFDTVEGITKSVQYALRKHGMEAPLESLRCFAGPPLVDKFMEVFGVNQPEAERLVTDFRERYRPTGVYESSPFPGIRDLLQHLKNSGLTLGIATSKPQPMAELLLDRSNLRELFDVVVGSTPGINNDRKSDIVKRTKYDVSGAHACSIPCAGVRWGYASDGELEAAGADYIAADMPELEAFLLA